MTVKLSVGPSDVYEEARLIFVKVQEGGGLAIEDTLGLLLEARQFAQTGEQGFDQIERDSGGVFHAHKVALETHFL